MIILLLSLCSAFELLDPFIKQACTRNSIFSLQIDDHFSDIITKAAILTPDFLKITDRKIESSQVSVFESGYSKNVTTIVLVDSRVYALMDDGLLIFNFEVFWKPKFIQRFRDPILNRYKKMKADKLIVLYDSKSFVVIKVTTNLYPVIVSVVEDSEYIQSIEVVADKIVVFKRTGVFVYTITDYDLGLIEIESYLLAKDMSLAHLDIKSTYKGDRVFALDKLNGILEFSIIALSLINTYNITGNLISGYDIYLIIDGIIEINTHNNHQVHYNNTSTCEYLKMDNEFIYCGFQSTLSVISRLILLNSDISVFSPIKALEVHNSFLILGIEESIKAYEISLGPLFIKGRVPDEVKDYKVIFTVSNPSTTLTEGFILSVQYSLTNVVVFILLSFIGIFILVFMCTSLCRYCNKETTETVPIVRPGADEVPPSTERNIMSDRALIGSQTNRS
ncbi:hypothetical protein SteCoe_33359 [Stentor coeruleus]|uniref:Uncharacterized protein n=1 Tax=Stentor coeruleus TaxID=5963 RepID=A0A1R2AWZ4_9CILI|nr:hypothetical protein SteCoe_33359 [Stentor coeruleus]